jgi:hypothetical protein
MVWMRRIHTLLEDSALLRRLCLLAAETAGCRSLPSFFIGASPAA